MRFLVLSRLEAENYTSPTPYVVISFGDATQSLPLFHKDFNRRDVCRVVCYDDDGADVPGERIIGYAWRANNSLGKQYGERPYLFTSADADKILDFVEKYKDISLCLIHCEAGISRSRGCALALSLILNGEGDSIIDPDMLGHPNALVVHRLLACASARYDKTFEWPEVFRYASSLCEEHPEAGLDGSFRDIEKGIAHCAACFKETAQRREDVFALWHQELRENI